MSLSIHEELVAMSPLPRVTPIFMGIRIKSLKQAIAHEVAQKTIARMYHHYQEDLSKLTFGDHVLKQELANDLDMSNMYYLLGCHDPAIACLCTIQKKIQDLYGGQLRMMNRITHCLDHKDEDHDVGALSNLPDLVLNHVFSILLHDL